MTQVEQENIQISSRNQTPFNLSESRDQVSYCTIQFEGLPIDSKKRKIKQTIHRYEAILLPKTLEIDQYIKEVQLPRFNNYLSRLKVNKFDRSASRSTINTLSSTMETSRSEEVRMRDFQKHAEDLRNYQDQQNKQQKRLIETKQKQLNERNLAKEKHREKFEELNQRRSDQFKEEQRRYMDLIMKQNQHTMHVNQILANKQKQIEEQIAKKSVINQVAGYINPIIPAFKNVRRFYTEDITQYNRWFQKIIQSIYGLQTEVTFDIQPTEQVKEFLSSLVFDYPEFYFVRTHKIKLIYQNEKSKKNVIGLERLFDYKHFTEEQIIEENKYIQSFIEQLHDYISEYQITKQQKTLTDIQKEALTYEFLTLQNFEIDETEHRHQTIDIYAGIKYKKCNKFTLCSILQLLFSTQGLESFIIQGMYTDLTTEQMTIQDINTKLHFWNAVQINEKFFYVDPVFDNGKNRFHFKHFNFNDTVCTQTRTIQKTMAKINICTEFMSKKELFEQIH